MSVSESALIAFASLIQIDSQRREKVRNAPTPVHVVNLASQHGHAFIQATLMKLQAEKTKHLHGDHLNNASSRTEELMPCFGAGN